jgi:hypothetical protein
MINNFRGLNEDVSPDLVSKAIVVASDHAEVALEATFFLRSSELNFPSVFVILVDHSIEKDGGGVHVITVGLDEKSIFRPVGISIVAEGPGLLDFLTRIDNLFVTEAFFHKTA